MRLSLVFFCGWISGWVLAQGDASYTLKGSFHNTYLFRGHVFHDDDTVLGELGVGIARWSYNLIYSEPLDGVGAFDGELHHSVSYTTVTRGRVTTLGYSFYDYNGFIPDTQEFYVRFSQARKWHFNYGLAFDFDTYKGYYLDFALTRSFPVSRRSSLVFSLLAGASLDMKEKRNDAGVVVEPGFFGDDGFNHGSGLLNFVWQPAAWFKVETGALYHRAFDDFLHRDPAIDEDAVVWRSSVTIRLP